jgi:hypothetical protein
MKKIISVLVLFSGFSCGGDLGKQTSSLKSLDLVVSDSVKIKYYGDLKVYGQNANGDLLIYDIIQGYLLVANIKGEILTKFSPTGEGPDKCGTMISNLAFFSDQLIVVQGSTKVCFYDLQGNLKHSTKAKLPLTVPLMGQTGRLSIINTGQDTTLISYYVSPLTYDDVKVITGNADLIRKSYKEKPLFTFFNLNKETYELKITHPQDGLYATTDKQFPGAASPMFATSQRDMFVLYPPEEKLYKFNSTGEQIGKYPCNFEYFQIRSNDKSGVTAKDVDRSIAINSAIRGIYAKDSIVLVTYSTGITNDEYAEIDGAKNWVAVMEKYNKYYASTYVNGIKKYEDILLSPKFYGISHMKSPLEAIMHTNFNFQESKEHSVIYFCKLVEKPVE